MQVVSNSPHPPQTSFTCEILILIVLIISSISTIDSEINIPYATLSACTTCFTFVANVIGIDIMARWIVEIPRSRFSQVVPRPDDVSRAHLSEPQPDDVSESNLSVTLEPVSIDE
jgi:hypothetical protein